MQGQGGVSIATILLATPCNAVKLAVWIHSLKVFPRPAARKIIPWADSGYRMDAALVAAVLPRNADEGTDIRLVFAVPRTRESARLTSALRRP